ncbi:hypothetical protein XarbCFBP7408_17295 [Xanthomonas arboricola pv. guizotiae]|uniref:Uncharacterized protein n=1 Tax=Xanthomonas arboricola pv. guizotiae TaxID=487867 RepID=A0A2S6ZVK2_9XANT|nr:hypothetical protein XarbCFBP7409_15475 [Xanthomonas arboricola pv. guizotiae]PPU20967.1 hypothetical protein XarbCFBP7408_17295 [Xanthomonas arboricola pv. guizotiae]
MPAPAVRCAHPRWLWFLDERSGGRADMPRTTMGQADRHSPAHAAAYPAPQRKPLVRAAAISYF